MHLYSLSDRVASQFTASVSTRRESEVITRPSCPSGSFRWRSDAADCAPVRASRVFSSSRESEDRFPGAMSTGTALASEFSQHINQAGMRKPLEHRAPTPMLPPTAVVAAQMDALQMNDWPDPDSGIRTAFLFSKPFECETMTAGKASPTECHSWQGREQWVAYREFADALRSPPLDVLLNCESWQPCSQLLFPSQRKENRAVQVVEVRAPSSHRQQSYTFTFCLERIDIGPYKVTAELAGPLNTKCLSYQQTSEDLPCVFEAYCQELYSIHKLIREKSGHMLIRHSGM